MKKNLKNIMIFMIAILTITILPSKVLGARIDTNNFTQIYHYTNFPYCLSSGSYLNNLLEIVDYLDNNYEQYTIFLNAETSYNTSVDDRFTSFYIVIPTFENQTNFYYSVSAVPYNDRLHFETTLTGDLTVFNLRDSAGYYNTSICSTSAINPFLNNYVRQDELYRMDGQYIKKYTSINPWVENYNLKIIYKSKNMNWFVDDVNIWGDYDFIIDNQSYSIGDKLLSYEEYHTRPVVYRKSFDSVFQDDLYSVNFGVIRELPFPILNEYNFRLQFGANDLNIENLPILNMINTSIIDNNSIPTDKFDFNDYFTLSYDCFKYYEDDYEMTCDGTIKIKGGVDLTPINGFELNFVFENLNNYYIHTFDNAILYYYWNDTQAFLKNYTRYCFDGIYDKAIIRSKAFDDIKSSMFIDKVYITNPDYQLNVLAYDFINNVSLLDYSDYLKYVYNINYLNYDFNISESTKIFPVLNNVLNSDKICFYLDNNSFVQFLNSVTLDEKIVGVDINDFNNYNDLIIFGDFPQNVDDVIVDYSDDYLNNNFVDTFRNAFNTFRSDLKVLYSNLNNFWINLPTILKYFYIVIFTLSCVAIIFKFIL